MDNAVNNVDLFELLPDVIFFIILTLLPFDQIARFATLGRRWNHALLFARHIDLDQTRFRSAAGSPDAGRQGFLRFVRRFYQSYAEPKVDTFRLCFSFPREYEEEVIQWVSMATGRCAESLELDFSDPVFHDVYPGNMGYFDLPDQVPIQLANSLQVLKLSGCHFQPEMLSSFNFLKVLCISRVMFCEHMLKTLLDGCRHLRDLALKKCMGLDLVHVEAQNTTLRGLTVEDCWPMELGVRIESTALQRFKYWGYIINFHFEGSWIREAEFDFGPAEQYNDYVRDVIVQILLDLPNVGVLTVCSFLTQVVHNSMNGYLLPIANYNVKHLRLKKSALHFHELPGVVLLLRTFPYLEALTIEMGGGRVLEGLRYPYYALDERQFLEIAQMFPVYCFQNHLQKVNVDEFKALENEMLFLRFLLGHTPILQELNINTCKEPSARVRIEVFTRITMPCFPKASSNLRITIT